MIGAQNHLEDVNMEGRPVRMRGQLMFDASHSFCTSAGKRTSGNSARRSGWKIHPVTEFDVCKFKTLTNCPGMEPR